MLVLVRRFFYTPDTSFSGEVLSYTPDASFSEEFPVH